MPDRLHKLFVERPILAFEVQHGHRLGGWGGTQRRIRRSFHLTMVPAGQGQPSQDGGVNGLKKEIARGLR
jgi:hypothetical protein